MRIITGRARGVQLQAPAGENTRPTGERAKEAIFSMLQFEIEDRQVLDLYAGSGQMGLEAVSRGAAHAVLVDSARDAVEIIKKNALKTKLALECEILCSDDATFLRNSRGRRRFDLIFLDPPYAKQLIPGALRRLLEYRIMQVGSTVVCESAKPEDVFGGDEALAGRFELLRQARYGAEYVTLLRLTEEDT